MNSLVETEALNDDDNELDTDWLVEIEALVLCDSETDWIVEIEALALCDSETDVETD